MAMQTRNGGFRVPFAITGIYSVNNIRVAATAGSLRHSSVPRRNLNRLVKFLRRERKAMPKTIGGFHVILPDEVMGGVAIIARGDVTMTGLRPPFILLVHDVAVDAGPRVFGEVRGTLGVMKRINAQTQRGAQKYTDAQNGKSQGEAELTIFANGHLAYTTAVGYSPEKHAWQ